MKKLVALALIMFASSTTWSLTQNYSCFYQDGERVHLQINGRANSKHIVYTTSSATKPVIIEIADFDTLRNVTHLYGVLPQPWPADSTFEIELRDMFSSIFKVWNPQLEEPMWIPMTCTRM